jgi:hypothetical protein
VLKRPRRVEPVLAVVSAIMVLSPAWPLAAQDPEGAENLQVLSPELSRAEINAIMRGFTAATGTRCVTCHVGDEGQPLSTYDFASDDKAMKLKAREMMRLVLSINDGLAELPDRGVPAVDVTCMTCHGGVPRPEPIEAIVERTALDEGGDAAVARYRELRERYFGRRAYDFGEGPLVSAGAALVAGEHADQARAVLELALEYHPRSIQALLALGRAEEVRGDTAAALAAYRRVLEIEPDHTGAQRRLQALGGG